MKKCHICGKRASISLTQIVNGQVSELALCEDCAKEKGLFDPQTLSFAEKFFPEEFKAKVDKIVQSLAEMKQPGSERDVKEEDILTCCPVCHFPLSVYRKTGRMGCPDCYTVFAHELNWEEDSPDTAASPASELEKLEENMRRAISNEDYETAAQIRDQIRALKNNDSLT